jgi:hypothetical protein
LMYIAHFDTVVGYVSNGEVATGFST